ncbi:MAG: protein kinase [Bryobacteraceae bacterium]
MSPERWERVKDLFVEVESKPAEERERYLRAECGGDEELRSEVERLLANDPSVALIDRSPLPVGMLQGAASGAATVTIGMLLAGRFRVVRMLGAGGMGEVYQAEDVQLGQMVAIKTVRPEFAREANAAARFRREISLARQVTHPGICRVYDFFSTGGEVPGQRIDFLTMEFVEGETLGARLKRDGPMEFEAALPVIRQVAAALDAAHEARVMHRDLKSSNVILGKDASGGLRAVVTDFGVARSMAGGDTIATGSGFAAGTPAYMAPEQLEGKELTPAADFYSLGVLMYEMATGTTPHASDSPLQIAARRMKEAPVAPSVLRPVAGVWERAILKCLEMDPGRRFDSGAELVAALESGAPVVKAVGTPVRLPRRGFVWAAGVVGLSALIWFGRDWVPAKPVSEQAARFYRDGVIAMSDGAYHKASQLLGMAVQAEPAFVAAHCRLAEAYQELDQRDKAREELVKALDGTAWARHERLLREATKFYLTGDWLHAAEALQARVGSVAAADRTAAMLDLARLYDRAGRSPEAMGAYRAVLVRDDSQPSAALRLAALLHASGKRGEVAGLLDRAERMYGVTQNPEGLGMLHLTRGDLETKTDLAVEQARKAEAVGAQIDSASLVIQAKLMQARRIDYQGKGEEARVLANDAVALAEARGLGALAARGLADLGMVPFSQRKYEEAEALFLRAVALAQRYGAKRTEALAKMNLTNLAGYQNDAKKLERGLEYVREAGEFFESAGDDSRYIQVRRYFVNLLSRKGQNDEAKAELERLLARSRNESDTAAVRTDVGKLAMTQGRFAEAEKMFLMSADYYRSVGDRQTEQNYMMFHARAMRSNGKLQDAYDALLRMEKDGFANETVGLAFQTELSGLEFQLLKFDQAIQRMERQVRDAEKKGQAALLRSYRLNLCLKYGEAERTEKALGICPAMLREYVGQPGRLALIHEALSTAFLAGRKTGLAVEHAEKALKLARQVKDYEDITYSLILLTQALHAAGSTEWRMRREEAIATIEDWKLKAGPQTVARYYELPVMKRRLTAIQAMN